MKNFCFWFASIFIFSFCLPWSLSAQIVPGQSRSIVESGSGVLLWESPGPWSPGKLKEVLYAGRIESGGIPMLALYVGDVLLMPIFFVDEYHFLKAMSNLQSDPNMTQKTSQDGMLVFASKDGNYEYKFSDALVQGKDLLGNLAVVPVLPRFVQMTSSYAIIHVDYLVAKALGYSSGFAR